MKDFESKIRHTITKKKLTQVDELIGCTESQIREVMDAQGVSWLPNIYMQFLTTLGVNAGHIWRGRIFTYPHLRQLKKIAHDLLRDDGYPFELPEDAFVFQNEEGLTFCYFRTNNKENDPLIFGYTQIEYEHFSFNEKLSKFLLRIY